MSIQYIYIYINFFFCSKLWLIIIYHCPYYYYLLLYLSSLKVKVSPSKESSKKFSMSIQFVNVMNYCSLRKVVSRRRNIIIINNNIIIIILLINIIVILIGISCNIVIIDHHQHYQHVC